MSELSPPFNAQKCIFVFDSPHVRSHLFFRYFSTSPNVEPIYRPFLSAAMFGPEYVAQHLQHSDKRKEELEIDLLPLRTPDTFRSSRQRLEEMVAGAFSRGKISLVNDHWYMVMKTDLVLALLRDQSVDLGSNPTHLPDELFATVAPIVLIRHPALSIRSIYRNACEFTKQRPGDEDFTMICSSRHLRRFFDLFRHQGRKPLVVDVEDLLWRTSELTHRLCEPFGLDPEMLDEKWDPTSKDEVQKLNPLIYKLTKDVHESTGIIRPAEKPPELQLDREAQKWVEQWGSEVASSLKKLAEDNMPHYEYLAQFKI